MQVRSTEKIQLTKVKAGVFRLFTITDHFAEETTTNNEFILLTRNDLCS